MNDFIGNLKIHVLDDELFMLNLVARLLASIGVRSVQKSSDARVTLASLYRNPQQTDVIIADLNMPEMDGIEFIRHLAAMEFAGTLIILSGEDPRVIESARNLARRHRLDVAGVIKKPISTTVLRGLLEGICAHAPTTRPAPGDPLHRVEQEELERAMHERELLLHYQPKIRLEDGRCDAVEGLLRWQHPDLNLLPPSCFIHHVEQGPLAFRITELVYKLALEQHLEWYALGHCIKMAVNLPVTILEDVSYADMLVEMAEKAGVEKRYICFEITETGVIENLNAAADILTRLRLKGFGVAIDDFGTGHSSLAQLKEIPFSELKIDRSFVTGSASNESWLAITETSVLLAKKLGMSVVAEGVETKDELAFVKNLGCEYGQGYLFSKPLHPHDLETWMRTGTSAKPTQVA